MRISVDLADPETPSSSPLSPASVGVGRSRGRRVCRFSRGRSQDKRLVHYVRVEQWDIA